MNTETGETMLSKNDVCKILNVSLSTIDRLMASKELPFHKVKRAVRFRREDVEKYLQETRKA